jgi:cell division septation protein DedD
MLRFFANGMRTISAVALVALAIAVMPTVATALAHSRPTLNDAPKLDQPAADQCAAFDAWFLDPACSKVHPRKAARTKHHLARNVGR